MSEADDMGEDALVSRLLAHWPPVGKPVVVGPGDDCAVIAMEGVPPWWQLLKTDAMVAGQHFLAEEDMWRVGWKAVARVQSDFAAMGGRAEALLVTIFLPSYGDISSWERLYAGMAAAAQAHGGILCGGETCRAPEGAGLMISVAGTGKCEVSPLLRSGASAGDVVCVTGVLGGSIAGHHLDFTPRVAEGHWLAKSTWVSAMMDVSDGLAKDLPRLCGQSGIGVKVDVNLLPCRDGCSKEAAMSDGEDYELLFTVREENIETLLLAWAEMFPQTPLQVIGNCVPTGKGMSFHGGWDPFAAKTGVSHS
jgi:thiamine-monophosphate kinase